MRLAKDEFCTPLNDLSQNESNNLKVRNKVEAFQILGVSPLCGFHHINIIEICLNKRTNRLH